MYNKEKLNELGFKLFKKVDEFSTFSCKVRKDYIIELNVFNDRTIQIANRYSDNCDDEYNKRFMLYSGKCESFSMLMYILSIINIEDCKLKEKCETVNCVIIDKSLDKYNDVVLFPTKLKKANVFLKKFGIPKIKSKK